MLCLMENVVPLDLLAVVALPCFFFQAVVAKSAALTRGNAAGQVGAIIDAASKERILG